MKTNLFFLLLFALLSACGSKIQVKTGDNYESVALPDGSQVYLNRHSQIIYEGQFSPRAVHLKGEAFFTVEHNDSPFTVITDFGEIEVLGTEFNVKTTINQVEVDVKKGLVELRTDFNKSKIKKDAKAVYRHGERAIKELSSNKEYRKWIRSLEIEFKKLGKEVKPSLKKISKGFKKVGKSLKKELKN